MKSPRKKIKARFQKSPDTRRTQESKSIVESSAVFKYENGSKYTGAAVR